jgi:hypothetical protein
MRTIFSRKTLWKRDRSRAKRMWEDNAAGERKVSACGMNCLASERGPVNCLPVHSDSSCPLNQGTM